MFQTLMVRKLFYTIVPNYHTWSKFKKSMNHTSQLFQTFLSFLVEIVRSLSILTRNIW